MNKNTIDNRQARLEEYTELLLKRDQLLREAGSFQTAYTAEFGELITANFELKIACIKEKKMISYCNRRTNRGLAVDVEKMQEEIDREMLMYYKSLVELTVSTEQAKNARTINQYDYSRAKRIYRRLAKQIHPDIFQLSEFDEELKDLWDRITDAYHHSESEKLEELEVLVQDKLKRLGKEALPMKVDRIEQRIESVEREINEILTTEPYLYGELLSDKAMVEAHRAQLQAEHDDYEAYLAELKKTLEGLLNEGGIRLVWNMN